MGQAIMKLDMAKVKIITQEMFNNCSYSLFGKVDTQELHKNKEELSHRRRADTTADVNNWTLEFEKSWLRYLVCQC